MNLKSSSAAERRPANILVVDDTPANLQVLSGMLKDRGYKVRPAPGGRLAIQAARHDPPDLILLDINMPDLNGYQVCEHLKADSDLCGIPIIFISALTDQLDKVRAFACGGVDYITKPFQMEELHARVETHLKLRRQQLELEEYSRELELARDRLKVDLEFARKVQRGLLPLGAPNVPGYEVFAHYQPAFEVGGDYYDFIPLTGQRMAILVGDVVGKGVTAALLMAKLSADARSCMVAEMDPGTAFNKLNALMVRSGMKGRFVTMLAAIIDPETHIVTMVNAGHPPPLVYQRASGSAYEVRGNGDSGYPLGIFEGNEYSTYQIALAPGDTILAFTDGVTEAMSVGGKQLEARGVLSALDGGTYNTQAAVERVVKAVSQFSLGRNQQDDIALVGLGRTG